MRWVFADFFLQKGARLRFLFAKLLLCPWLSKKKRTRKLYASALCSCFFCFSFFERTKKRSRFLPFRKNILLYCWFWERKGSKFPFFFSKSPRSARPALSKNAIALFRFRYGYMKRCYIYRKGDIKTGRQAGCSPKIDKEEVSSNDRGAVSFHLSGIDPLTMGWEANRTDCRQHQRDRLLSSVADLSFSPMIYLS